MSQGSKPIAVLIAAFLLLAAVSPARGEDAAATPPVHHKSHKSQKKDPPPPLVLPPLPPGPLQQVPMDKIPATAPHVTYENGQLKIVAENSTLGSILKDVRRLTGASIDLPANGAPERVVTNIGPGAPRDVLAVLLNGTQFNYVMLGSNSDPAAVSTVVLSPKPGSGEPQTVANAGLDSGGQPANGMAFRQQMANQQQANAEAEAAEDPPQEADATDDKPDDSDQNQQVQPETPQPDASTNGADQANQPNAGPKTPEQLLEMMRQRMPGAQQPGQPGPLNPPNSSPPEQ